jgi:hypothetical protein
MLEFDTVSSQNYVANTAWWTGFLFACLAVACILWMLWKRSYTITKRLKTENLIGDWERILFKSLDDKKILTRNFHKVKFKKNKYKNNLKQNITKIKNDDFEKYIPLIEQDLPQFLYLWNYIHESLRGEAKTKLNKLGEDLKLAEKALKMLAKRNLKNKLIAIETLGNLNHKDSWQILTHYAENKNPVISLWAVIALFRINKETALKEYFHYIAKREDWSPVFVAKLLKELTADFISKHLSDLVGDCYLAKINDKQLARVISYLSLAHSCDYQPLINQILSESFQQEILISCLRLSNSVEMLPQIRKLAKDSRWQVRMQVVLALGRFGNEEDINFLIASLNDIEWWVRYRSAYALTSMPFITEKYLVELTETLPNEFARDILKQVLSEIRMQCLTQPSSMSLSR